MNYEGGGGKICMHMPVKEYITYICMYICVYTWKVYTSTVRVERESAAERLGRRKMAPGASHHEAGCCPLECDE